MPNEIELKLGVPKSALPGVATLPWLRSLVSGPMKREKLVSVYFDSRKFKLRDHGVSLRVRHVGRKRIQTIKATGNGAAGAFGRKEWEEEIASDRPNLKLAADTALEPLATKKLKRRLRPVFETTVERITMPLDAGDCQLDLVIDRGRIKASDKSEPISEIELELKRGDPVGLSRIAERIARFARAEFGVRMKAERGYALAAGEDGAVVYGDPIVLDARSSAGHSFRIIGAACLRHFAANRDAIARGDFEGVHQMRVGLRRLRAAMTVFKDLLTGSETDAIKAELRWLQDELGPARDFDVLVKEGVDPAKNDMPEHPELGILRADMSQRRKKGIAKAKKAVAGQRYRQLVLSTALYLVGGHWATSADALVAAHRDRNVVDFATRVLSRRTKSAVKKARKIASLDDRQRHKVRIAIKKLRYSTSFFESLFPGNKARARRRRYVEALKTLQDALGRLNDISVHAHVAQSIVDGHKGDRKSPEEAFAIGILVGREQSDERRCLDAAVAAGGWLAKAPRFWR